MFKLTKNVSVNEKSVECICVYNSKPLRRVAEHSRSENALISLKGRSGFKSMIVMDNGSIYLCPYSSSVYYDRAGIDCYATSTKHFLALEKVHDIVSKPGASYRRLIKNAKLNGTYVNLSRDKRVNYYIFMYSGRIYGVNNMQNLQAQKHSDDNSGEENEYE